MREQFLGCILGLACSDALGMQTEFRDLDSIRAAFGPAGIQDLPEPALFTDDTQMSVAVGEALARRGDASLDELGQEMRVISWLGSKARKTTRVRGEPV